MRAAVVTFWKGSTPTTMHVGPGEVSMVLSAAGGNGFANRFDGYTDDCDADENDGRCSCFDEHDDDLPPGEQRFMSHMFWPGDDGGGW